VSNSSTPDPLDQFVALSAILTGIAADKLHPQLDTHGTAAAYLAYATQQGGSAFTGLLALYAQNSTQPPDTIAKLILQQSGQATANIAQAVTLMWYLGAWYPPAGLAAYQADQSVPAPFVVISSDAYTQGWAWRVGQAHPMGYSDLRFGYWNGPPQALADLVGGS
jgi:hypothetical protein